MWLSGRLMAVLSHSSGLSKNVHINIYFFCFLFICLWCFWIQRLEYQKVHSSVCVCVCFVILATLASIFLRWRGFEKCRSSRNFVQEIYKLLKLSFNLHFNQVINLFWFRLRQKGFVSNFPRKMGSTNSSR